MAIIGVRRPYYAIYSATDAGVVTYSNGGVMAKAVEFSASVESASDNDLYADDGIAESDRTFSNGTVSITTDDLTQEASAAILGITPTPITVGGTEATEIVYGEPVSTPYLGFGIIISKKRGGVPYYRAVILPKIMFNFPEEAATTQGQSIEWQTPTIEGTIMRDDTPARVWKREATFTTEANARAYIEQFLQIPEEA